MASLTHPPEKGGILQERAREFSLDGVPEQDHVIQPLKSLKTVPVAFLENVCGRDAAVKPTGRYSRRFSGKATGRGAVR